MANTLITPSMLTKESLRVLHANMNFVGSVNRQYDSKFAQTGAKIGANLSIRNPVRFTTSVGQNLAVQDVTETSQTMTIATQRHIDFTFPTVDLTLTIDEFSSRYVTPAMSQLAAQIEADALSMALDVPYMVGTPGTVPSTYLAVGQANARMTNSLAPRNDRNLLIDPTTMIALTDSMKGLFAPQEKISKQYLEGRIGRAAGLDFYENTLLPTLTMGTQTSAALTVNGASQTGTTLNVNCTNAATLKKGTVFTIAGVFEVHYETKTTTNRLQQFVVTADATFAAATGSITIYPAITAAATGYQTVNASPANAAVITFVSGAVSTAYPQAISFQKDAFTFVSADLELVSDMGAFAAREVMDGISMRIVRQYQIGTDTTPCRIDVLYGYKTIRPELACRITS